MTAQYAFLFDAKFCSGCKACQAACKDKNNLPPGVLWRRVMEVAGGNWKKVGERWNNSVFAYNISISCNHCLHPKCAGICPVNAYVVREDGIVILDETKCIGCGYCAWGCPYGAPQYNPKTGHMTNCDFCFDSLEQGLPPACVAACPLRVLDYGDMTALSAPTGNEIRLWDSPSEAHPHPLPVYSHTQPRLAIKKHPDMWVSEEKYMANKEEVQPRRPSSWDEAPLMLFTLLSQMAVGGMWVIAWMFPSLWALMSVDTMVFRVLPLLLAGICLGAGILISLAHLGTKKNVWRVLANLKRSSLSREALYMLLFGISVLFTIMAVLLHQDMTLCMALSVATGFGLVHHMAQVYRLPAAPGWNTRQTNAGFLISALLLGTSIMAPVLAYESAVSGIQVSGQRITISLLLITLLLAQLGLLLKESTHHHIKQVRIELLLIGIVFAGAIFFQLSFIWINAILLVVILTEESLGRWLFYRSRI